MNIKAANRLLGAFADENRLKIVYLLSLGGELCVCELVAAMGMAQPKISQHLAILRREGLVTARREGRWMHYSLARPESDLGRRILGAVGLCVEEPRLRGHLKPDESAMCRKRKTIHGRKAQTAVCVR